MAKRGMIRVARQPEWLTGPEVVQMVWSWNRAGALAVTGLALTTVVSGCGKSGPSDAQQVRTLWTQFFSSSTSVQQKAALLQNGPQETAVISSLASNPLTKNFTISIASVTVAGTTANVTYSINAAGRTVGPFHETAVKVGGKWVVSLRTFCDLVDLAKLGGLKVSAPGCPA
jgi:hypothetical protein